MMYDTVHYNAVYQVIALPMLEEGSKYTKTLKNHWKKLRKRILVVGGRKERGGVHQRQLNL